MALTRFWGRERSFFNFLRARTNYTIPHRLVCIISWSTRSSCKRPSRKRAMSVGEKACVDLLGCASGWTPEAQVGELITPEMVVMMGHDDRSRRMTMDFCARLVQAKTSRTKMKVSGRRCEQSSVCLAGAALLVKLFANHLREDA